MSKGFMRSESLGVTTTDTGDPNLIFNLSAAEGASGDFYYYRTDTSTFFDENGNDDATPTWAVDGSSTVSLFGGAAEISISSDGSWTYSVVDPSLFDFSGGPLTATVTVAAVGAGFVDDSDTITFNVTCFTRGTLIKTQAGEVPIEQLEVGDKVLTVDAGYQPIRWIGGNALSRGDLEANPRLKPIRIRADALGPGLPEQDLLVSPQHRVLVRSVIAQRMFDTHEVLIPANKLLTLSGIDIEWDADGVEYFHMLFDAHQLVWSNGAVAESLFTGPEALKAVSPEAREEIATLFPEIVQPDFVPTPARFIPEKGKHMKVLAQRLAKNNKTTQESHNLAI